MLDSFRLFEILVAEWPPLLLGVPGFEDPPAPPPGDEAPAAPGAAGCPDDDDDLWWCLDFDFDRFVV